MFLGQQPYKVVLLCVNGDPRIRCGRTLAWDVHKPWHGMCFNQRLHANVSACVDNPESPSTTNAELAAQPHMYTQFDTGQAFLLQGLDVHAMLSRHPVTGILCTAVLGTSSNSDIHIIVSCSNCLSSTLITHNPIAGH